MAFAPVKGERPEWVVQKLTELGIDRIVPAAAASAAWCAGAVRGAGRRSSGCAGVAREAAAQCRRVWLPEVTDTVAFADLASLGAPGEVVLAQLSGDRPTRGPARGRGRARGRVEHRRAGAGLPTVGFGLSVLRAETAAVTAGALLASLRTGTVAAVEDRRSEPCRRRGHPSSRE